MRSGIFAAKPVLRGERVELRPFTVADIEAMGPILADPEVLRLTGSVHTSAETIDQPPELDAETRRWSETRAEQPDRLDLAIVDRAADLCVGEAVFNEWSEPDASCNFRVLIAAGGRDRGLGLESTRLMLDHAFTSTEINRIELAVYAFNPRAQHVYERAGFRVEGRKRESFTFDGQRFDSVEMAILRADHAAA